MTAFGVSWSLPQLIAGLRRLVAWGYFLPGVVRRILTFRRLDIYLSLTAALDAAEGA